MIPAAVAQVGATAATPVALERAICLPEPRAFGEISAIQSDSTIATPAATTAGVTIPAGTPASESDIAAINVLVNDWLACQNAGEPLRAWSYFSDGYLKRMLARQGAMTESGYLLWATPTPQETTTAHLLEMTDARQLPDGRLGATVRIGYDSVPMPKRFFFYFRVEDGDLRIDGILGEISFSVP